MSRIPTEDPYQKRQQIQEEGSGTPAMPSAPDKLYRRIPASEDFPHGLLQEVDISTQIAAAVAAEREECAKLAEAHGKTIGEECWNHENSAEASLKCWQLIAAAIRSRASQPAQHIHTANCYKCGHDDCPCHGGYLH